MSHPQCPNPRACDADQTCIYRCFDNSVEARYLRQKEMMHEMLFAGPSDQHRAECDCPKLHGFDDACVWPQCDQSVKLLKVTSVEEEHKAKAKEEIVRSRIAFYGFLSGCALTSLVVWLFNI